MSIGIRIKELRKDILKLNQTEFGAPLGLSQSAIGGYESEIRNVSDQSILAICREYNVREEWLREGTGKVFEDPSTFSLDEFAQQHGATELELNIMKAYFELDPDLRGKLVEHFRSKLTASRTAATVSVEDAEELYKKSRSNSAQSMGSSASNTTGGTEQSAKEA